MSGNLSTLPLVIRSAAPADRAAILSLADRLAAFGPTIRPAAEIAERERRALADGLAGLPEGSKLLVAEHEKMGVVGVLLLDRRRDYFTGDEDGHVAILAVALHAEGQGVGRALLAAAEAWGRAEGFRRLTLSVFTENQRAREFYHRQGWRAELETWYKAVER
jgi:GNAT superfamily N-acetyltransferase